MNIQVFDIIDKYLFSGAVSNATYDLLKWGISTATEKSWADIVVQVFYDAKDHLAKDHDIQRRTDYIGLNEEALRKLSVTRAREAPELFITTDQDTKFEKMLVAELEAHHVLELGGFDGDMREPLTMLVKFVRTSFRNLVIDRATPFEQALFKSSEMNYVIGVEVKELLQKQFSISVSSLDNLQKKFEQEISELKDLLKRYIQQNNNDKRIFISYSRKDTVFARGLYDELKDHGYNVWRDRDDMKGGQAWWNQIEDQIEQADILVLILSPDALASYYVKKEWQYARQVGTYVLPIIIQEINFSETPRWLDSKDCLLLTEGAEEVEKTWKRFYQQLNVPPSIPKVPLMVKKVPQDYVERHEKYNAIRNYLLDDKEDAVGITTSLEGAGGYGKTTLATAIANDGDIQWAFYDGILYTELGRDVSAAILLGKLKDWITKLKGICPDYTDLHSAEDELRGLLAERCMLLIIDDVWKEDHLKPFIQGGERCAYLVTTRFGNTIPNAKRVNVDYMTASEALELVSHNLDPDPAQKERLRELVKRCGYHAQIIGMARANLEQRVSRYGESLDEALDDLFELIAEEGLEAVDINRLFPVILEDSLSQMRDENNRERYYQLAIFPEDTDIPLSTLGTFWSISASKIRRLCQEWADLSLLLKLDLEENKPQTIRLHDNNVFYLQHKYAEAMENYHNEFLNSYKVSAWHNLPKDAPYIWEHLVTHLCEVQRTEQLLGLFADSAWMKSRVTREDYRYDGYVSDLQTTWEYFIRQAQPEIENGQVSIYITHIIRLLLIRTSINSLASSYIPELIARAVDLDLWTAQRGVSIANRMVNIESRAKTIIRISQSNKLSQQDFLEAIEAILSGLSIVDEYFRAQVLGELVSVLSGSQVDRALEAGLLIVDESYRAQVLVKLASVLSGSQVDRALEAGLSIVDEYFRAQVLGELSSVLSGSQVDRALEAGLSIVDESSRALVLGELVSVLSVSQVDRALEAGLLMKNEYSRVRVLGKLASVLSVSQVDRALEAGLLIKKEYSRAQVLGELVSVLSVSQVERALEAGLLIKNEYSRAQVLGELVSVLSVSQVDRALEAGLLIKNEYSRAQVLGKLASVLSGSQAEEIIERALEAGLLIKNEYDRVRVLGELASVLSGSQVDRALEAGLLIKNEYNRVRVLSKLASVLSGSQAEEIIERALEAGLSIVDESSRAQVLGELASVLSGSQVDRALEAGLSIVDESSRAQVLGALASVLSGSQAEEITERALEAGLSIVDESSRVQVLGELASVLSGSQVDRALEAGLLIKNEYDRVRVLGELASVLSGSQVERALEAGLSIVDEYDRVRVLSKLGSVLSGSQVDRALEAGLSIVDEYDRALVLGELGSVLSGSQAEEIIERALEAGLAIKNESSRARVLGELASVLSVSQVERALEAGLSIVDEYDRALVLGKLASVLSGSQVERALEAGLVIKNESSRALVLGELVSVLSGSQIEHALEAGLAIKNEFSRARVLTNFIKITEDKNLLEKLFQYAENMAQPYNKFVMLLPVLDKLPEKRSLILPIIHQSMLDSLVGYSTSKRERLLRFLSSKDLWIKLGIPEDMAVMVARDIVEICNEWSWL
jgi:type III secretion system FlhB-like substrate exporter